MLLRRLTTVLPRPVTPVSLRIRSLCSAAEASSATAPTNAYEILGVSRESTLDQIKAAQRKLAKKYHPDLARGDDNQKKWVAINRSWQILSNARKRAAYDKVLVENPEISDTVAFERAWAQVQYVDWENECMYQGDDRQELPSWAKFMYRNYNTLGWLLVGACGAAGTGWVYKRVSRNEHAAMYADHAHQANWLGGILAATTLTGVHLTQHRVPPSAGGTALMAGFGAVVGKWVTPKIESMYAPFELAETKAGTMMYNNGSTLCGTLGALSGAVWALRWGAYAEAWDGKAWNGRAVMGSHLSVLRAASGGIVVGVLYSWTVLWRRNPPQPVPTSSSPHTDSDTSGQPVATPA